MSAHVQLLTLKKEAKVLIKLQTKLSDQLNRLKVEELALLSQIRAGQMNMEVKPIDVSPKHEDMQEADCNVINQQPLFDLGPSATYDSAMAVNHIEGVEEEEEEEEEEGEEENVESAGDQLSMFLRNLQHQTNL